MSIQKFVISNDPTLYEAWPDVTLTVSGKLVCVFSECTHHGDRSYTRIMLTDSCDRGRSWTPKRSLTEGTRNRGYFYNCPRISRLSDGRLVVIVDKLLQSSGERDLSLARNILYFSTDDGATWSEPIETPLTGIVGAVDAIRGGALDNAEYKERCIATLASQSERLNTLLLNFLTLASLDEENPVKLHNFMPVFPLSLLRAVEEVCRSSAEAAGIEIAITECDSAEFRGDVQLLQQALDNLVINAVIHSGTQRIELAAVRNLQLNCIDLIVKDYGCGIPPEHQDRVFNRFYRVPTGNRRKNGSGIGLTIVKRVALYHRGTVILNSEAGRGSEFHLRLPL